METTTDRQAVLVVTAAGSSQRMGGGAKKEFLRLPSGLSVLAGAIEPFVRSLTLCACVVTYKSGDHGALEQAREAIRTSRLLRETFDGGGVPLILTEGGKDRQESVYNGLEALQAANIPNLASDTIVLVHDGARPFVTEPLIQKTFALACARGAAVPALEPSDTHKEIDENGKITRHLDRSRLAAVQTPQAFLFFPLLEAHRKARAGGKTYTDDTEIWNDYAAPVYTVRGEAANKKITYPADMPQEPQMIHTGLGYDIHRLIAGRPLLLGGVHIPFDRGEDGHSDGDVLLHAVTDALLGAAGLGDIGSYFPPSDMRWKDADSALLLRTAWQTVTEAGWRLGNIDCVVVLEAPKLLPYREHIRQSIADILGAERQLIFVKAKTREKLGEVGSGAAAEAYASCLLYK